MRLLVIALLASLGAALAAPGSSLTLLRTSAALEPGERQNVRMAPGTDLQAILAPGSSSGWLETPPIEVAAFDTVVVSWNASTPPGASLRIEARARVGGRWTRRYALALWGGEPGGRRSFSGERDADGRVDTDTLVLAGRADALQIRVTLASSAPGRAPTLTGLAAVTSDSRRHKTVSGAASDRRAWGLELPVPPMSQMLYPNGGEVWCSPTATTMILSYWGEKLKRPLADPVPVAARATWDSVYDGAGNWPFNTAYAAEKGLAAYVSRLSSLAEAEEYVRRGVPLALSIAWGRGELEGAHVASSNGHLVVLRGFTRSGDPIINDPAGRSNEKVRTVYRRAQLERAWVGHSGGVVYVVHPPDWP